MPNLMRGCWLPAPPTRGSLCIQFFIILYMFLIIPIHNHMQYDPDAESALHRREVVAEGCILTCVQMFVGSFKEFRRVFL